MFIQHNEDRCVHFKKHKPSIVILAVYVDDIITASNDPELLKFIIDGLKSKFQAKEFWAIYTIFLEWK